MKVLLTGATGYIGKRLLPVLIEAGHEIICCVRDTSRFQIKPFWKNVSIWEVDFLKEPNLETAPKDFDVAYFLIHSLSASIGDYEYMEMKAAKNFNAYLNESNAKQVIYLSGIASHAKLSRHLESRLNVEKVLKTGKTPLTVLRAGIIVGSGSASFEIIRDLTEKLPVMIAPKWVNTKCQPIAVRNVIQFLNRVALVEDTYNETYDIGCEAIFSYKEMLLGYARQRKLKRWVITVPVTMPRLSAFWLYFITTTSYELAVNLVESMMADVVCNKNNLAEKLNIELLTYADAVSLAFGKIKQNRVLSSWKDALVTSSDQNVIVQDIEVPDFGCFFDKRKIKIPDGHANRVLENIWSIGGNRGWYYATFLWKIRGYMDKLAGGVGLRRGRTNPDKLNAGDALDFWRVIYANKEQRRLVLYAEMKLPGEAWLEFAITEKDKHQVLHQKAVFRPSGVLGRLYWYSVLPFHYFIFQGMAERIVSYRELDLHS